MGRFDWLEIPGSDKEGAPKKGQRFDDFPEKFDSDYYLELAYRKFREGEYKLSLQYYSRVLRIDRNSISAWVGQVRALVKMNELEEAKIWVEKALTFFPKDPQLLATKALLLCKSGLIDDAMAYSDNSLKDFSTSYYPWVIRGEILLTQKNIGLAKYCFEKAEESEKDDSAILFDIGDAYFDCDLFVQAVEYFRRSVEVHPSYHFRWFRLANAYEKLGCMDKAKFYYEKVLEIKPDFQEANVCLRDLQVRKSDFFCYLGDLIKSFFARES